MGGTIQRVGAQKYRLDGWGGTEEPAINKLATKHQWWGEPRAFGDAKRHSGFGGEPRVRLGITAREVPRQQNRITY